MSAQIKLPIIDYLFAGAGASATLLLMSLERRGLLSGKNIVILDPDPKSINDKTYCFWCDPNESPALECRPLISHEWTKVSVNRKEPESLSPLKYFHLSSIDLYKQQKRIIQTYGLQRVYSSVLALEDCNNGVIVKTDQGDYHSQLVFDSRPPKYLPPKENEAHLLQSFIGFVIETEMTLEDSGCIDLMDFNVDQQDWTQFVYVIPFSHHKLLVELTRFGQTPITLAEAEPLLYHYISNRFGKFTVMDIERGCIPMSNSKISHVPIEGVVTIGGRAGAVKPSTGYAFKNMFNHAEILAESMQKEMQQSAIKSRSRFQFYDKMLLLVLSRQPTQGKPIFITLFKKNKTLDVLKFLDEKSSPYEDFRLLKTLPIKPFLHAWCINIFTICRQLLMPILTLFLALSLLGLHKAAPLAFNWINTVFLSLGLLSVGIPHGAVDHLADTGNFRSHVNLKFILSYLSKATAYLLFWLISPNGALILFLIYSAWHFGQGDINHWQLRSKTALKKWIWGGLLLAIILCGHMTETNLILENMGVALINIGEKEARITSILLVCFGFAWATWEWKPAMLLSCCMLAVGIQLPLITSFGLYFIGQHSVNGWSHLKEGLHTGNLSLFLKAFPFTAGAFLLFGALLVGMETGLLNRFNGNWLTTFFVFISCISFPHVMTMHKFYKLETTFINP
jgi:lycopene beta-cyclase